MTDKSPTKRSSLPPREPVNHVYCYSGPLAHLVDQTLRKFKMRPRERDDITPAK